MATASKRKTAITNMVARLQTIVAGGTYFRTLNIGDNVSTKIRFVSSDTEGKSFIRVRAGNDDLSNMDLQGLEFESRFEILLEVTVKDASGEAMVEELEDLLHDISLCLGGDRTLSGAVHNSWIDRVEAPTYGIEEIMASTIIHVICISSHEYGSSI